MLALHHPRRISTIASILGALALATPSTALAQGWLADRSRTEGPGIRLGDFELHPGIGLELGYDSNVYYTADNPTAGLPPRTDSAILRVTPHLLVSTLGDQRRAEGEASAATDSLPDVTFRGGVWASYYEFFADERRRNLSLDAGLRLNILPGRTFSVSVYDDFSRSIRPFVDNTFETSTARDQNRAGVDFTFSSTGGIFQVRTGYRFTLDYFEGAQFQYGNSFNHTVELQETFRFLPQTAVVHDTAIDIRNYFSPAGALTMVNDSVRVTTRVGLNGAITPEISVLGMIGYSAGFYDSRVAGYDQDYESVVAQAQVGWRPAEQMRFNLGYQRSFAPSFIGNYMSIDRGYATWQMLLGGSFMLGIEAGVSYLDFGQVVGPMGEMIGTSTNREDIRIDANLFLEYRFTDWLGVNGTLGYQGDFTDFQYRVATGMGASVLDPAGYNKFEAWLGVRVFY